MTRGLGPALALGIAVLAPLAACGGGGGDGSREPARAAGDAAAGAAVFEDAGCGGCHEFAPAGSSGTIGPSLDGAELALEAIVEQVEEGGGGMPAFADELTPQELADVAAFVASG